MSQAVATLHKTSFLSFLSHFRSSTTFLNKNNMMVFNIANRAFLSSSFSKSLLHFPQVNTTTSSNFDYPLNKRSFCSTELKKENNSSSKLQVLNKDSSSPFTYEQFVEFAKSKYQENKTEVDNFFASLKSSDNDNELTLFMEGTPDSPLSKSSLNIIKILTQAQIVPFKSVNILQHPAIYGGALSLFSNATPPFLMKKGSFFVDHDQLLKMYTSNQLNNFSADTFEKNPYFKGELPVALY